jgi:hypothetical protein
MTIRMVHQESAVPLSNAPSLFPEEWVDRCAGEIAPQLAEASDLPAVYRRFRETHPALFLGVYLSPGLTLWHKSKHLPPLRYEDDQLWLDPDWSVEPAHPVEVLRVPRHRLIILVAMDSLLVLRESELVAALGGSSSARTEQQIGGGA